MNTLTITCCRRASEPVPYDEVRFVVDGIDMLERVHAVEAKQRLLVQPEEGMEGSYWNLSACIYTPDYLLGRCPDQYPDQYLGGTDGRTILLDCQCGMPGCWPFMVRIAATDRQVTWSDFAQRWIRWDYSEIGPFCFDKEPYLGEVRRIQAMAGKVN